MQNGSFLNTYLFLIKPFLLTKFDCITKLTLNGGIRLLSFNFLPTISWQKKLNESNNLPLAFGSWSSTQVFQFIVQTSPESRISNLSRKIKCWHCYIFLILGFLYCRSRHFDLTTSFDLTRDVIWRVFLQLRQYWRYTVLNCVFVFTFVEREFGTIRNTFLSTFCAKTWTSHNVFYFRWSFNVFLTAS